MQKGLVQSLYRVQKGRLVPPLNGGKKGKRNLCEKLRKGQWIHLVWDRYMVQKGCLVPPPNGGKKGETKYMRKTEERAMDTPSLG